MKDDHFTLARRLQVPHAEAVVLARSFCPSGSGTGPHGSTCPCGDCTLIAVTVLADLRDRGRLTFTTVDQFLARQHSQ